MSYSSGNFTNRPFENLNNLISVSSSKGEIKSCISDSGSVGEFVEKDPFIEEMKSVNPLGGNRKVAGTTSFDKEKYFSFLKRKRNSCRIESNAVMEKLNSLVLKGHGFDVSKTPEYDELICAGVPHLIAEKLHNGRFSVQAYIDLHGYIKEDAIEMTEKFLKESFLLNRNAVLIVHGRGLSSPGRPVLKKAVSKLLSSNYWRRRIYAYTSARNIDGGAGGTYVLLRKRALTGKEEKTLYKKRK